jgi:hypothetical protein
MIYSVFIYISAISIHTYNFTGGTTVKKQLLFRTFVLTTIFIVFTLRVSAQINFSAQSGYKYLKGINAGSLSSNWMNQGFNDNLWSTGNSPFWYGDSIASSPGTKLADMRYNYTTLYLRTTFTASQIELLEDIILTMNFDDGFVMWINGSEALRINAPEVLSNTGVAPDGSTYEYNRTQIDTLKATDLNLVEGINTMAIQCFNASLTTSTDFFFDFSMSAAVGTPELKDTIGLIFSSPSGFKNTPFSLTITSSYPTANVIYTLDGSNPQNSTNLFTAGTTATINIDPNSTTGRGTTPAVVVRASLTKTGYKPSKPESRTFIFIESVKTQGYPGGDWPNYNVNGQILDYPMDANVVYDPRYINLIDDALLDIPTISVITDNKNLFDPSTGIYVNGWDAHGEEWEKQCSVELINPDGSEGFNVNAGLRIRGGWSRNTNYPKHAFRLFFRKEYGDAKLYYPLFGKEGVDEFDKVDLRCEQNYSWAMNYNNNSLVREVFSRDTQRDMGQPYTRSRYYHLYLNGLYYGMYQTQERTEARFSADYMGGDAADYDVVKVAVDEQYAIEPTDGNLDGWQKVYTAINKDLTNNANYFILEGKDADGNRIKGAEIMVDIDNLIDYMLIIFYTGNFDAPVTAFHQNKDPNNFYAIDNRKDISSGFKFFAHDAEHAMLSEAFWPGIGLYENRVNIGSLTDGNRMEVNSFDRFHPQWLHFKLSQNAEYRMRFADRAFKHLQGEGALTPAKNTERINKRVAEIDTAVIAESARWGDMNGWTSFTKDDNWLPEIDKIIYDYIPYRTNIVISQLKSENLYTSLNPPTVKKSGTAITAETVKITSAISAVLNNPNTSGAIYYTLDGSDPREVGGTVSSKALSIANNASINISSTTLFKARIYHNDSWSALKQINFVSAVEDYSNLKVTEIHYHPAENIVGKDTTEGKDLEFIEFKNIGDNSVNLTGLVLDSAVYYVFPNDILLGPKKFWVVASKPSKFFEFYGKEASGNFSGNLGNSGDTILLTDALKNPLIYFAYYDDAPWPTAPDGDGYSLVSSYFNPTGNPAKYDYWRASLKLYGSPFRDDDGQSDVDSFEMLSESNLRVYPNPASDYITISVSDESNSKELGVSIYTINGSLIYQSEIANKATIDLKALDLQSGMYFIQVETNKSVETAKLIFTK